MLKLVTLSSLSLVAEKEMYMKEKVAHKLDCPTLEKLWYWLAYWVVTSFSYYLWLEYLLVHEEEKSNKSTY